MKKLAIAAISAAMILPGVSNADYLYGFGNVSYNSLDWSDDTEDETFHEDFDYVELEGGAGYTWGELYGFFDIENFREGDDETRTAYKGVVTYKTGFEELRLYGHHYATDSSGFSSNNTVTGVAYRLGGDGWFVQPFFGAHFTVTNPSWTTGFSGMNGQMAGWTVVYRLPVLDKKVWLSNWHEMEMNRHDDYLAASGEDDDVSTNGAVAIWYDIHPKVTGGIQYRYASSKLGVEDDVDAAIFSLRYNF